jgi:hypothetical protein
MPLRRLYPDYGTLEPEELSLLQDVFDEVCAAAGLLGWEDREAVARKLLTLFKAGTTDRRLLKAAVETATAGRP